eukprot:m.184081 g.184081  ORF g.184081 m.184081 type:complete len:279 (+) comp16662_c0_seq2:2732-3568(+)
MAVLWFVPMRPGMHALVFHATEIVHAWAALEVFVLAIIVALLQLRPLAAFIIGSKCTGINKVLALLMDSELDGNDKCFDVVTELNTGCFVLIGCCLFSMLVTVLTLALSSQAVKERNGLVPMRKRNAITFILGSSQASCRSSVASYYQRALRDSRSSKQLETEPLMEESAEDVSNVSSYGTSDNSDTYDVDGRTKGIKAQGVVNGDKVVRFRSPLLQGQEDAEGSSSSCCASCFGCGCGNKRTVSRKGNTGNVDEGESGIDLWAFAQRLGLCKRVIHI